MKREVCKPCNGTGYYQGPRLGDEPCPICGGWGRIESAIEILEKMRMPEPRCVKQDDYDCGWNQAIDRAIERIQEADESSKQTKEG